MYLFPIGENFSENPSNFLSIELISEAIIVSVLEIFDVIPELNPDIAFCAKPENSPDESDVIFSEVVTGFIIPVFTQFIIAIAVTGKSDFILFENPASEYYSYFSNTFDGEWISRLVSTAPVIPFLAQSFIAEETLVFPVPFI